MAVHARQPVPCHAAHSSHQACTPPSIPRLHTQCILCLMPAPPQSARQDTFSCTPCACVCVCVHACVFLCACVCVRACVYTSVQGVCLLPLTCVRCGIALYARSPRMKAIAVTVAVHPSPQHAHNYHTRFCLNVKSSCIKWSCRSVAPISLQDAAVTAAVDAILHSSVSALSNMFSHL